VRSGPRGLVSDNTSARLNSIDEKHTIREREREGREGERGRDREIEPERITAMASGSKRGAKRTNSGCDAPGDNANVNA
jgi:hypothetical protein